MSRTLRAVTASLVAVATMFALSSPAAADPAGPTDFQTDIVEITPGSAQVTVEMIGGDSFIQLEAESGVEVIVVGYRGEPYLRFDPTGAVFQNELSPSRWLNDDRYGETLIPPQADANAVPEWIEVADGGTYAWHDHRTHWMNQAQPPGVAVGGIVLEAVVPLLVDGEEVAIHVQSRLLASPSPLGPILGVLVGVAFGVAVFGLASRRTLQVGLIVWAGLAAIFGTWAVLSVPSETAPSPLLWLLPVIAAVAAIAALVWSTRVNLDEVDPDGRKPSGAALFIPALTAIAGIELLVWAWFRRQALVRALIPSDAPDLLDRAIIAGAVVVGVVAIAATVRTMFVATGLRSEPRSERPARHHPPSPA
ncbi:MAG: hypothetical protein GY773_25295 [Actinomycetia bacterium]|nr:hypothetical protein [Actinomycetes bacterium]